MRDEGRRTIDERMKQTCPERSRMDSNYLNYEIQNNMFCRQSCTGGSGQSQCDRHKSPSHGAGKIPENKEISPAKRRDGRIIKEVDRRWSIVVSKH